MQLCRKDMQKYLEPKQWENNDPHPGLLLVRGLTKGGEGAEGKKQAHIQDISRLTPSTLYKQAFQLWQKTTGGKGFANMTASLTGRLYIGVARDNALETGITTSHTYGMPMIPGSACKGLARAVARKWQMDKEASAEYVWTFGSEDDANPESGGLVFHDAWWVPEGKPFVQETITVHHQEYYSSEGGVAATDFDSPIPAPQIATRGKFYFVVEGPEAWVNIGLSLLRKGLVEIGVGAKKSSGYGFFDSVDSGRS